MKLISMYYGNVTTCSCNDQIRFLTLATCFVNNSTTFKFHVTIIFSGSKQRAILNVIKAAVES